MFKLTRSSKNKLSYVLQVFYGKNKKYRFHELHFIKTHLCFIYRTATMQENVHVN